MKLGGEVLEALDGGLGGAGAALSLHEGSERTVLTEGGEHADAAVTKVTQRVNLFEKVLIPQARNNVRRIQIALGDVERAAVVTSKIAKRKREATA